MTVTEQINLFIKKNGGNERDALNVALAQIEQLKAIIEQLKSNND